jgi:signal transduction histidine kinase
MPPYWQRQWFRFLMLIVLSVVVYAIFFNQEQKRKLAQEKVLAEQSARYKSQFLANMSHEIRTPMNAVLGMSHLLEDTSLDTQQTKYVGSIKHSAEDLLRIINDILDYSKIESGQFTFQRKPVHLKELLGHVEQSFAYRAMDKSLAFAIVIDPKLPEMIWADPVRLSQILSNLISNAIKFTEKGSITVAVNAPNPPSPQFQITVQDTGIGIPAENLDSIFESFNQVDEAYATSLGGTGLGLAIARQLANQQGGSIQVDSAVGVGTIFTVYLPLIEVEKTVKLKDDTQQVAQSPLSGIKILLVEDVYFNQLLATEMLKKHIEAVHIDLAENGQIALEMVQAAEYDLVLMDVKMPVMDGYTAARLIRTLPGAYYAQLPILALTANAIPEQVQLCLEAGMNDCVTKPLEIEVLLDKIRLLVNTYK